MTDCNICGKPLSEHDTGVPCCPYCGGAMDAVGDGDGHWFAECQNCFSGGPYIVDSGGKYYAPFMEAEKARDAACRRAQTAADREVDALRKQVEELRAALGDLVECQNGPPLATYEKQWRSAMAKADALIYPK